MPAHIPYLPVATLLWGLLALVWTRLEASLLGDGLLAGWGVALLALWLVGRAWGGRWLPAGRLVGLSAAVGLAWGVALGPVVLLLMSLKTGLHGHGPEYTTAQITWVLAQWPWWVGAGALAGLGLGLVTLGLARSR